MLVKQKRFCLAGCGLAITFFLVFFTMFCPIFGEGRNAFEASDNLFNSISKGSIHFIPALLEKNKQYKDTAITVPLEGMDKDSLEQVKIILSAHGIPLHEEQGQLLLETTLGKLLVTALNDSAIIFDNDGAALRSLYTNGHEKEIMYSWWRLLAHVDLRLKAQKQFAEAAFVHEVKVKGVEVAYNYYGIDNKSVKAEAVKLILALLFYVLYTMWWGYAIFFIFEGLGLTMTGGSKAEI